MRCRSGRDGTDGLDGAGRRPGLRRIVGAAVVAAAGAVACSAVSDAGPTDRARPAADQPGVEAMAQGAAACSLQPTDGTVTRSLGSRSYRLHVPAGLTGPTAPLLISLHGAGQTATRQEVWTGWSDFADRQGLIVAYPEAVDRVWDTGQGSPDVAFLGQVADDVADRWCVDDDRIYADGHSNGGFMSQRLACDLSGLAAVVEYAGGSPASRGSPCTPARPIGVALFHGEADPIVPASMGRRARDEWVERNGCGPEPTSRPEADGALERHTGCDGGVEVWWRTYPDQGHLWPVGPRADDQRRRMWEFLTAHPRPG